MDFVQIYGKIGTNDEQMKPADEERPCLLASFFFWKKFDLPQVGKCTILVLNQLMSSRSASIIFSFLILLMEYSIVTNTIKSTLNTLIPILPHGNTK